MKCPKCNGEMDRRDFPMQCKECGYRVFSHDHYQNAIEKFVAYRQISLFGEMIERIIENEDVDNYTLEIIQEYQNKIKKEGEVK